MSRLKLVANIIYIPFNGSNYEEIISVCIKKLILFEKKNDYTKPRPSEYDRLYNLINDSKGACSQAAQLVHDNRSRTPFDNIKLPSESFPISYRVVDKEFVNCSKAKRLSMNITVPSDLTKDELRFNLKHCVALYFNKYKPDAVIALAYLHSDKTKIGSITFSGGRAVFAPFGRLDKMLDGFAYNVPAKEFDYSVDFAQGYFE